MEQVVFFIISAIAVISALFFVLARNPLYSVLSLVVTFFSISGLYILLNAQFLGAVQVIVYAGAIMVLFLYVLMMLNLNNKDEGQKSKTLKFLGVFSFGILIVGFVGAFKGFVQNKVGFTPVDASVGLTKNLGKLLFSEYVLPFELASILILSGIVGAVLIGKKDM